MDKAGKIKVTVDKSHLFTLGEKMYRESIEFVRELVNNAYDADATEARVHVADNRITVEDNGSGMNERGLEQFFTIGSEEKQRHGVSPRFGRKRIGQFGIGKFSALAIADRFLIESVKGRYKYSVVFDRAGWKQSDAWELPIRKEETTPLDREGVKVILDRLTKKVGAGEIEKYLRQSVPLRAKKFAVYLNNKRITAKTVPGKIFPVKINTMYGVIEGQIVVAINSGDVDEPGIDCQVKEVFIKRELFGLEKKYHHGINRLTGFVNANFLPLISSRSDFILDSSEYRLFRQTLSAELEKILKDLKKQKDAKNIQKINKELQETMKQIREALMQNPDFVPQGRAITRLKKEGRRKMAAASASVAPPKPEAKDDGKESNTGEKNEKREKDKPEEKKLDVKPLAVKRIRVQKLGISCGIVGLGEEGPEVISQGNAVYINQDHPLYQHLYKKRGEFVLHLLRLLTQEIVIMKKPRITAREAFDWQSKLLKDTLPGDK